MRLSQRLPRQPDLTGQNPKEKDHREISSNFYANNPLPAFVTSDLKLFKARRKQHLKDE